MRIYTRALLSLLTASTMANVIPENSKMASASGQKVLLNPMEQNGVIRKGAWQMTDLSADMAKVQPKVGAAALALKGKAKMKGAKGDFVLAHRAPGKPKLLAAWIYMDATSNASKVGFQFYDGQGEALLATVPVDWTGWKWVEIGVDAFTQAYPQKDKNQHVDFPIKSVHAVWFSAGAGPSTCIMDSLTTATTIDAGAVPPTTLQFSGNDWVDNGKPLSSNLVITNYSGKPASCAVEFSLQEDSRLYNKKVPDAVLGSDHADEAKSWIELNGKKIDNNSLTDGDDGTTYGTPYQGNFYTEVSQFVDMGKVRELKKIGFVSGDANWCWRMNVLASADGETYSPVPDLQNVKMHKRWGKFFIGPHKPFKARFLKLHYMGREGRKENVIRLPGSIILYDGVADETIEIPKVGPVVETGRKSVSVPANSFAVVSLNSSRALDTGGYFVGVQASLASKKQVFFKSFFVMPKPLAGVTAESRFGINGSTPSLSNYHKRMGIGWVRFENMKWCMISPAKDKYAFDGSVGPWHVPQDRYIDEYVSYGLSYLPYVFQTPRWASTAPDKHRNVRGFPPKDYNDYGTCIFQIVARYGSKKHPESALLTPDKKSGLNKINVVELWNEPNLNAESWGPWVGPIEKYFDIFKVGAEAAKKADPSVRVTSCGWAGITLDVIGKMGTYKYANGKTPLDYTDILNVHYYSGKADPERATIDRNVVRGMAKPKPGTPTYEDNLRELVGWWNKRKPGKPIWLTETGNDVGGPMGRDERYQAAKVPRVTMMALAAGIEKVFIYREKGSTPTQHAGAGFLRNDGSVRPSWFSFSTLVRQLHGVKTGRVLSLHIPGNDEIWGYLWDRNGEKVFSVWALDDRSVLPLKLGKCKVVDSFGKEKSVDVNGDLKLSILPVYISGISNLAPVLDLVKQAEAEEKARVARAERRSKLQKYLFDFGSKQHVGVLKGYGPVRHYKVVLSQEIYTDDKGYGFDSPGLGDNTTRWMRDMKDKDAVKVNHHTFKVKAKPGTYVLQLGAQPFSGKQTVKIGEKQMDITKKDPYLRTTVKVGAAPLTISFDGYTWLRWASLIEKDQQ